MSAYLNNKPVPFHLVHDYEYDSYTVYPNDEEGFIIIVIGLIVSVSGFLSNKSQSWESRARPVRGLSDCRTALSEYGRQVAYVGWDDELFQLVFIEIFPMRVGAGSRVSDDHV